MLSGQRIQLVPAGSQRLVAMASLMQSGREAREQAAEKAFPP
jgi:hypothetical protein